jgi:NAD(P)-dependent dehydrogenase (short-subunit alcohol dehydrogenase family)
MCHSSCSAGRTPITDASVGAMSTTRAHVVNFQGRLARTPANRWGKSDEIIGAAVFLASRGADFITGVTLPVDGGYSVC